MDIKEFFDRGSDTEWRDQLGLQDLTELRETAKKVSTKTSGNKQDLRDAIIFKLAVYEEMYKGMNKAELKDVCQTRGIKGVSTLAKEGLVNKIIRSHFEGDSEKKSIPVAIPVVTAETIFQDEERTPKPKPFKTNKARADAEDKARVDAEERELAEAEAEIVRLEAEAEIARIEDKVNAEKANAETETKKKKASIPKKVKTDIWNTYIGADINKHRCLCCKKTLISNTDFDVGHVVSEACGGTLEIGNLRPICAACNHAMGARNMVEFVKTYGYYIG